MEIMEVTQIKILVQETEEALDLMEVVNNNLGEVEIIKDKDLEEVLQDFKVTVLKTLSEEMLMVLVVLVVLETIKMMVVLVDLVVMILIKDLEENLVVAMVVLVVVMVDLAAEVVVLEIIMAGLAVVMEVLEEDSVVILMVLEVVIEEETEIEVDTMAQTISDYTKIYI
jgi:hypothetical protein